MQSDRHPGGRAGGGASLLEHVRTTASPATSSSTSTTSSTSRASASSRRSGRSRSPPTPRARWPSSSPSSRSSGCAPRPTSSASSRTPSTRASSTRCGSWRASCVDMGIAGAVGADQDGYPGILGYQGPSLSEVTEQPVTPLAPFIESMMVRKSEAEVALIRESARWCEHAHRLLQEYTRPGSDGGRGEPAGGPRGDAGDARRARPAVRRPAGVVRRRLGRVSRPDRAAELVGPRGRPQHRVPGRRRARHRDERPDLGLQRRARARDDHRPPDRRDAPPLRPHGRRSASRLRRAPPRRHLRRRRQRRARATSRRTTCCRYWRQHVGHAIGLRNHEAPFLDVGDHTPGRAGHGVHDRARRLLERGRRLPPLGHRRRHPRRDRHPHRRTRATSRA